MYGGPVSDWDMLAVDLRGTGGSAVHRLPGAAAPQRPAERAVVRARRPRPAGLASTTTGVTASGTWIHASDLFTSAQAAADVADVRPCARHSARSTSTATPTARGSPRCSPTAIPQLVRSVILDSTYSTRHHRPLVPQQPSTRCRPNFDAACLRSPHVRGGGAQEPWRRIVEVAALGSSPVTGTVPDAGGRLAPVTMGPVGLIDLINDAAGDPLIYRALDAAARSLLASGDPAPLLRLYAQRLAVDEEYTGIPPSWYSGGLYLAVSAWTTPSSSR